MSVLTPSSQGFFNRAPERRRVTGRIAVELPRDQLWPWLVRAESENDPYVDSGGTLTEIAAEKNSTILSQAAAVIATEPVAITLRYTSNTAYRPRCTGMKTASSATPIITAGKRDRERIRGA